MPGFNFGPQGNTNYYTIDTDELRFKTKDRDGGVEMFQGIRGYLADVRWEEDDYEGRPANKFVFEFVTEEDIETDEGETKTVVHRDLLQSGESSVFSSSLINRLLQVNGQFGQFVVGMRRSEGGYIVPWVKPTTDTEVDNDEALNQSGNLVGKYSPGEFKALAKKKTNGDRTELTKLMVENVLAENMDQQGTVGRDILERHDTEATTQEESVAHQAAQAQSSQVDLDEEFDDIDDGLPF